MKETVCASRHVVVAAWVLGALAGASALADEYSWSASGGGAFETAGNWSPTTGPPGSADNAIFDLGSGGGYTVTFSTSPANTQLWVKNDNVTLDLGGGQWSLTSASPRSVIVGQDGGDSGQLLVTNGTLASVQALIAVVGLSTGEVTVGSGGVWNMSSDVWVGQSGAGSLVVTGGGSVASTHGVLGVFPDGTGAVVVTGTSSLWHCTTVLKVGGSGEGSATVSAGGEISMDQYCTIGDGAGSTGQMTVTGADSLLDVTGNLTVGQNGAGRLTVADGAAAEADFGYIGFNSAASGEAIITGAGSAVTLTNLYVGDNGQGRLTVSAGGSLVNNTCYIGDHSGSYGQVTVSGAQSTWTTGTLRVGSDGHGVLTVADGARVTSPDTRIGRNAGSRGEATVTGAGSLWAISGWLGVGSYGDGSGSLVIADGADVTVSSYLRVGEYNQSSGAVKVTGAGSTLTIAGEMKVGCENDATGSLRIEAGGAVSNSASSFIGRLVGADGQVTVTGPLSTWTCNGNISVGYGGSGLLKVADGGTVWGNWGTIGSQSTALGRVEVSGAGAVWNVNGECNVGSQGAATGTIANGGRINCDWGFIRRNAGSAGEMTVTGSGALWQIANGLTVGSAGTGTLTVAAGATVNSPGATIGSSNTAVGYAAVTGAGSAWNVDGSLSVGNNSSVATLAVADGGLVSVTSNLRVRAGSTLRMAGGTVRASACSLEGGTVIGSGTVDASVTGASTIAADGGRLALGHGGGGAVAYNGTTEVHNDAVLELLCEGHSLLGPSTTITNGVLIARNNIGLDPGDHIAGYGVIVGAVSGGVMDINTPTGRVNLTTEMDVGDEVAKVYSTGTADFGRRTTMNGGWIQSAQPIRFGPDDVLAGGGDIWANVILDSGIIDAASPIYIAGAGAGTLSGCGVLVGSVVANHMDINSPTGTVSLTGELHIGARTAKVYSVGAADLGSLTTLDGGTLDADHGVVLASAREIRGSGMVNAAVAAAGGSRIAAEGSLTLGDAASPSGFATAGTLEVGAHTVTLRSQGPAELGPLTTLQGGALAAINGVALGGGEKLIGHGSVNADVALANALIAATGGAGIDIVGALSGYGITIGPVTATSLPIASAPTGKVVVSQPFAVGASTANVYSNAPADVQAAVTLGGGTIHTTCGVALNGGSLTGFGTVNAAISGGSGITARAGKLTVGDAASPAGFDFTGTLSVQSNATLEILDADAARLGGATALANGVLIARNGVAPDPAAGLQGYGVVVLPGPLPAGWQLASPDPWESVNLTVPLEIGAQMGTVFSAARADLAGTTLGSGTLVASAGVRFAGGHTLSGHGAVTGDVALDSGIISAGSSIDISGSLSGCGVIVGQVNAGSFDIASPVGSVNLTGDLDVGGATATIYSAGVAALTGEVTLTGGAIHAANGLSLGGGGGGGRLSGFGTVNAAVHGGVHSRITASGGGLTLGEAASYTGFRTDGTLEVGSQTVTLRSAGFANLGAVTTLAGGTLSADNGVVLGTGDSLVGAGSVSARLSAGFGSTIEATGGLQLGDAGALDGFFSDGQMRIGHHAVTLRDANRAVLGAMTTLGDAGGSGTLSAPNGSLLEFGKNLTGRGVVGGDFLTNGHVQGPVAPDVLEFAGLVSGVGSFDGEIQFSGGYSPGLSPAAVDFGGSVRFGPSATLYIEIGGEAPGSQHDRLNVAGQVSPGGTLDVTLTDGFLPEPGDAFTIIACGSRSGEFAAATGLDDLGGYAGLDFELSYDPDAVELAAVAHKGDANLDARVDVRDLTVFANNFGKAGVKWRQADFNRDGIVDVRDLTIFANNFGWSGTGGGAGGQVPEPACAALLAVGLLALVRRRRTHRGM